MKTPAIDLQSFSCPHCNAIAHQRWGKSLVDWIDDGHVPVTGFNSPDVQTWIHSIKGDPRLHARVVHYTEKLSRGDMFLEEDNARATGRKVENLHISECFSCKKLAVWLHDRLMHPARLLPEPAHIDMPEEIACDFREARNVFDGSPRASAALLRLCVQKLCKYLNQPGENINSDIAALVKEGLSPRLQKALDTVRVTGNEVVHPGVIDLEDDRELASSLFTMVNLIVDEMISRPKHVDEMYAKLPQSKRDAIEARDKPKELKGK